MVVYFFFFKQKTAYEMRISDWSSDVCSSDLAPHRVQGRAAPHSGLALPLGGLALPLGGRALPLGGQARRPRALGWEGDGGGGALAEPVLDRQGAAEQAHEIVAEMQAEAGALVQIGRASCRERVCQYV